MQPIDEKFWKNTHLSTEILVILIPKPQSEIYNSSIKNEKFPKIGGFSKIILKMQHIDEKIWKNTHLLTNILVILISLSQSKIYNSSL